MKSQVSVESLVKYSNKWIALKLDRSAVIASADDPKKLMKQLEKDKIEDSIVTFVLPPETVLAPVCL